jgi:flagellar hook-associated protein 2
MATFTSLGIGSGVDLNTMVTQLVALERAPLKQLETTARKLQTQVSSFGQIQSLFGSLQDASNRLTSNTLWQQGVARSSDDTAVGASGGSGVAAGSYAVTVQRLAGSQTVASATPYGAASDLVGAGTLTFTRGTWADDRSSFSAGAGTPVNVTVTASDTLQTLRDKINGAGAGVTATLVSDANGVRLALRASSSGAANGFTVTSGDAALAGFTYEPGGGGMAFKAAGQNALATVNGIAVESASNELSGVVEGLTFKLRKESATPVDVTVDRDTEAVSSAVKTFAEAYNALVKFIAEQVKFDATSKVGGPLQGDSAASGLQRQLRAILAQESGASAAFPRLSDAGLHVQRDGTLSVDSSKLGAATAQLDELKKAFARKDPADSANDGFARRYADLASKVLGVDGSISTRQEGLRKLVTKNRDDQGKVEERAERVKARLVQQYTALDANLSKLNALSGYVSAQLAALSNSRGNDR